MLIRSSRQRHSHRRLLAVISDMLFQSTAHDLQKSFKAIDLLLEFTAISDSKAWLLPFLVNADSIVARAPATGGLDPIAFYFSTLA